MGDWYSVGTDSRKFHIELSREGLEMTAPDLKCHIKIHEIQNRLEDTVEADVETECFDEGITTYSSGQIKLYGCNNYLLQVMNVYRRIDELEQKDEKLRKPETFEYLYRRVEEIKCGDK